MSRWLLRLGIATALLVVSAAVRPAGGPLGIDPRLNKDDESGIWARDTQWRVFYGLIGVSISGALIEGTETRAGLTFWRAVESGSLALVSAETETDVHAAPAFAGQRSQSLV